MMNTNKKKQLVKLKINTKEAFKQKQKNTTMATIDTLCKLHADQYGNPYCMPICESCPTPSELLRNKIKVYIQCRRDRRGKRDREQRRKRRQESIQERRVNTTM